jgi:hypothetical protein
MPSQLLAYPFSLESVQPNFHRGIECSRSFIGIGIFPPEDSFEPQPSLSRRVVSRTTTAIPNLSPLPLRSFPNSCPLEIAITTIFEVSTTDSFKLAFPSIQIFMPPRFSNSRDIYQNTNKEALTPSNTSLPQYCRSLTLIKTKEVLRQLVPSHSAPLAVWYSTPTAPKQLRGASKTKTHIRAPFIV